MLSRASMVRLLMLLPSGGGVMHSSYPTPALADWILDKFIILPRDKQVFILGAAKALIREQL